MKNKGSGPGKPGGLRRACLMVIVPGMVSLAGCRTVPLEKPQALEAPLFEQIDARIGTHFDGQARTAVSAAPQYRVEIGKYSEAAFRQAFGVMFTHVTELPDWPPWREGVSSVDGVMEVQQTILNITLSTRSDSESSEPMGLEAGASLFALDPDYMYLGYHVCLYEPDGVQVQCWLPSVEQLHRRKWFECASVNTCLAEQVQTLVREATARLMTDVAADPAVQAWAAKVAERKGAR
jgi:hypothetical protein